MVLAAGANLICWLLTMLWAGDINEYVWGKPGHPSWPNPPAWLPLSQDTYRQLNLYLSAACAGSAAIAGLLIMRIRPATALTVIVAGIFSGLALSFLSMIATF